MKNDCATQALSQLPNLYFHVALIYHFLLCALNILTHRLINLTANNQHEAEWGTDIVQRCGACNMGLELQIFSALADPLYEKIYYKYFSSVNYPYVYYVVI